MKKCTLVLQDEVNCKFDGLDIVTRRKLSDKVKFLLPYARHTPAFKLGRWDGMLRYCDIGGRTYINLLEDLLPIVQNSGYDIDIIDQRQPHHFEFDLVQANSYSNFVWPEGHRLAGQPVVFLDHQVECINAYLSNPQGVQSISTGAGKTLITAVLSHKAEKYGRTIVIVPSKDLVTQTEEQYINLELDVGVFFGDRKEYNKTHTICTWQSLDALDKKSKQFDSTVSITDFVDGVACVMVDEGHGLRAEALKKMMSTVFASAPIRWSMTGTIPQDPGEKAALLATVGPIINTIKATDLQDAGVLALLDVNILQLQEPVLSFGTHADEYKYLTTDQKRINWLGNHVDKTSQTGNTLILVNRIETGEKLIELLPEAVFISGKMKSKTRKGEYKSVQTATNKIIVATYGVAAVGIDMPRIFNLYLFEPGKSFVRVIQSIGRGIRIAEDKDYVNIFDICSSLKYSKKHLTERKRFYREQGYPHTVTKIDHR